VDSQALLMPCTTATPATCLLGATHSSTRAGAGSLLLLPLLLLLLRLV